LQNGQFDTSTAGWTASYGSTITRSATDAGGSSQSGSLDLSVSGANADIASQVAASQCLSAAGGAIYALSAQILIPNGGTNQGSIGLWFYASTDCSGSLTTVYSSPASVTNAWQTVTASKQAPTGVHSMAVRLQLTKAIGMQSAEALFDNVSVMVE
jgi:hypothetical protein